MAIAGPLAIGEEPRVRPFLKWAGGKGRLIPELLKRLPDDIDQRRYIEPFVGGGALFFALRPHNAHLGDLNERLIDTYVEVRDSLPDVLRELRELEAQHSLETFKRVRELLSEPNLPGSARAAAFIYLNRTCFNGLYRVNRAGKFNVPFGHYADPNIYNEPGLYAAASTLKHADLYAVDFDEMLSDSGKRDFIYMDPPYVPISETSSFTSYTEDKFDDDSQLRLRETFIRADKRGARVMLSQANHDFVRRLYKGFVIQEVQNSRSISASGSNRGKITELIVRNYR